MLLNFIFIFFKFSTAISHHLCICQPDRPGPVCSLDQKCNKFNNENQILLIQKNCKTNNKVNIFNIIEKMNKEGHSKIDLVFDVFGSLKSNPIIFDFSDAHKLIDISNDLNLSIKIFGGEWKQVINLTGFNSPSEEIWSKLSLSLQNIAVLLDMNNSSPVSSKPIYFDSFDVQKSRLIVPPGKYAAFNTHNLYTDTISSYSDFNGKISTNHLSFIDTDDPKIISNFNSHFIITNTTYQKKKKALIDSSSSTSPSNFRYFFCLTTKDGLERALENMECEMHGVPTDTQHYINVQSTDVIDIIKRAPNNTAIRFYLTEASSTNPCSLNLPDFDGLNLSIFFQIANPDYPSYFNLKSTGLDINKAIKNNISVSFHTIETVNIDTNLLSIFSNVTLKSSQLVFADDETSATVQNLVTDMKSLAIFQGYLNIAESIELLRTQPVRMDGFIILQDRAKIIVPQISNFPHILFRNRVTPSQVLPDFLISLCDELEYIEVRFYFSKSNISLIFSDDITTITNPINLTFRTDINGYDRDDFSLSPMINIVFYVPPHGFDVTFGESPDDEEWPPYTIFYFEGGLEENMARDQFPMVYLHINDADNINGDNANTTVFMIFRSVSIYVYSFESFAPFMEGINYRHNDCPITIPFDIPNNKHPERCHQVNTYNITNVTLDIGEILKGLEFANKTMFLTVTSSDAEIKVPDLFDLIIMMTTSSSVTYNIINDAFHNKTQIQKFSLYASNPINIDFSNSFVGNYSSDVLVHEKLTIIHDITEINLTTSDSQAVPFVCLDNPVSGVNFKTGPEDITQSITIQGDYFQSQKVSTRKGPNIRVQYSESVEVPQPAFLGNRVHFFNTQSSPVNMNFYYWDESIADYLFNRTNINIRSKESWNHKSVILSDSDTQSINNANRVDFKAKSITLDSRSKITRDSSTELNCELNSLTVDSIETIPSESFSSPIITHDRVHITDNTINRIVFSTDSIRLYSNKLSSGTATIRLVPTSNTANSISSSSSRILEDTATPDQSPGFYVQTDSNEPVDLSVEGSSVPDSFHLNLTGKDPQIILDKSWNNVQVPDDFIIESPNSKDGKYKVDTDLAELPNGFKTKGATITHKKQKLTKNLGFIIFIVIFGVIFVVALILCIIGLTCMPHEEVYDFSSDGNNGLPNKEFSDDNIDRSVTEEEIKKDNENQEVVHEPKSTERNSTAIEQQPENNSEDTDDYFEEVDTDTEENKKNSK